MDWCSTLRIITGGGLLWPCQTKNWKPFWRPLGCSGRKLRSLEWARLNSRSMLAFPPALCPWLFAIPSIDPGNMSRCSWGTSWRKSGRDVRRKSKSEGAMTSKIASLSKTDAFKHSEWTFKMISKEYPFSVKTLRRRHDEGKLPARKPCGCRAYLVNCYDLRNFLEGNSPQKQKKRSGASLTSVER